MHVALLANSFYLDEELATFRHLVVGLMDEQVRVTQIAPERIPADDLSGFGVRQSWRESAWSFVNSQRVRQLSPALQDGGVNVVHAMEGGLWRPALALAADMDVPVVLAASAADDVGRANRLSSQLARRRAAVAATTEPIGEAMRQGLPELVEIEVIPAGQYPPQRDDTPCEALCIIITGTGDHDGDYEGLLSALAPLVEARPDTQLFIDSTHRDPQRLWRALGRLNLTANSSLIPRRLGHRELLLRAAVLIQPQAMGRSRSLILQAMLSGMTVLAKADPWVDYLIPDVTAWVPTAPAAAGWGELLKRLVEHPEEARRLGESSREWAQQRYTASRQVGLTLDLYRRLTGEALRFPAAGAAGGSD